MSRHPTVIVPMVAHPVADYGTMFQAADILPLMAAAQLLLPADADVEAIAANLEQAASLFVGGSDALSSATPGELAAWTRAVETRSRALLECFARSADGSDPLVSADHILRGPHGFIEAEGLALTAREEIRAALLAVRKLGMRAQIVASQYDSRKGAKRRPPMQELDFVAALASVYREGFGAEWTLATDVDGVRGGSSVRFCKAVAEHIEASNHIFSDRDGGVAAALARLKHPASCAERIRDARSGGKVRNR